MLYIVSTHIGNVLDMTFRSIEVLKKVDFIICEEKKITARLLKQYQIENRLIQIDKHQELESSIDCIQMLKNKQTAALVSDCGTPNIEDPGNLLIQLACENKIQVTAVPGVSSLSVALSLCPFYLKTYFNVGFLSRKIENRLQELKKYKLLHCPLVIFETPYRFDFLLNSLKQVFKPTLKIFIGFDLTTENEKVVITNLKDVLKNYYGKKIKREFIFIISEN